MRLPITLAALFVSLTACNVNLTTSGLFAGAASPSGANTASAPEASPSGANTASAPAASAGSTAPSTGGPVTRRVSPADTAKTLASWRATVAKNPLARAGIDTCAAYCDQWLDCFSLEHHLNDRDRAAYQKSCIPGCEYQVGGNPPATASAAVLRDAYMFEPERSLKYMACYVGNTCEQQRETQECHNMWHQELQPLNDHRCGSSGNHCTRDDDCCSGTCGADYKTDGRHKGERRDIGICK